MTKVKAEGVPQHTEVRLVDGVERVFVVRELLPDPKTQRTTIRDIGREEPRQRDFYVRE
jgi:hypothetical protein